MNPIKELRDTLHGLVEAIDISEISEGGWAFKGTHPPKQRTYPGFWVEPANDTTQTLDSISNDSTFTFWISIIESYQVAEFGEDTTIELAGLIRTELLKALKDPATSWGEVTEAVFDGSVSAEWGFEERLGERVYRISVPVRVTEEVRTS